MKDDFRVAARLENRAAADELVAQFSRIDEVAVMANGNLTMGAVNQERLGVLDVALARG